MSKTITANGSRKSRFQRTLKQMVRMKSMYLMILVPLIFVIAFQYVPMNGIVIAFKRYRFADGIWGSQWYGFKHFTRLFNDIFFSRAIRNTLTISITRILITFPAPIIFALLLNEVKSNKYKRITQTISYVPHFISWVIIGQFVYQVFSPQSGVINAVLQVFGQEPIYFVSKKEWFVPILMITYLWQGIGWGSIVYLAAITGVDPQLYEAAELDGANRLQRAIHITLPGIAPIITIQLILTMGSVMNNGLDPILNLSNGSITEVTMTLEYYSYNTGLQNAKYDYAAAIGLFQTTIGFILLLITNAVTKRINEYGIW